MEKQKAEKQKGRLKTRIILAAIMVVIIGLLLFIVLFNTTKVTVVGNTRYTDEEICDMTLTNPLWHNTVLFTTFFKSIDMSDIEFMDSVNIEYVDRNTIRLNVVEKQLVGAFRVDGTDYYFDETGLVMEAVSSESVADESQIPLITGVGASNIGLGHVIKFENEDALNTIIALTSMVKKYDVRPDIVFFDIDMNITLYYGDVTVLLGTDTLLEEKMIRMAAILEKLEGYKGTLHLENFSEDTKNIVFDIDTEEAEDEENTDGDEYTDETETDNPDGDTGVVTE